MKIQDFLCTYPRTLARERCKEFDSEIARRNLTTGLILLPMILLFELFNALYVLFFTNRGLSSANNRFYFIFYLSLLAFSLFFLVLALFFRKKVSDNPGKLLIASYIYTLFICLWSAGITLMDLRTNDNISVYFICLISISIFLYMRPWQGILLFAGCQLFLLTAMPFVHIPEGHSTGSYINTTFAALLCICISISRYHYRVEDFQNRIIITDQNRQIREINEQLNQMVHTDALSGLNNRRYLESITLPLWKRKAASGIEAAVVMIDIDDFKQYNDFQGHQAGDRCIRRIAQIIQECISDIDGAVIRYGGEEFMIVIFGVDRPDVERCIECVRSKVENLRIENTEYAYHNNESDERDVNKKNYITISAGICLRPMQPDSSLHDYLSRADHALYEAKKSGKNCFVFD